MLITNIAWVLRLLPILEVFGADHSRLQPIHVHDFAELAVAQGAARVDRTIDASGPETYTYRDLVRELARIIGVWRPFFFSSRRRHTRFDCDWSSDVCSSD